MNTTKVILGMAAAAAVGAAIGMLLAPEKGVDLQKRIKDGAQQWLNEVSNLVTTGRELAQDVRSESERQIGEMKSNLSRIDD